MYTRSHHLYESNIQVECKRLLYSLVHGVVFLFCVNVIECELSILRGILQSKRSATRAWIKRSTPTLHLFCTPSPSIRYPVNPFFSFCNSVFSMQLTLPIFDTNPPKPHFHFTWKITISSHLQNTIFSNYLNYNDVAVTKRSWRRWSLLLQCLKKIQIKTKIRRDRLIIEELGIVWVY